MKVTFFIFCVFNYNDPPSPPKHLFPGQLKYNRITMHLVTKTEYNHYVTIPFQGMYPCILIKTKVLVTKVSLLKIVIIFPFYETKYTRVKTTKYSVTESYKERDA